MIPVSIQERNAVLVVVVVVVSPIDWEEEEEDTTGGGCDSDTWMLVVPVDIEVVVVVVEVDVHPPAFPSSTPIKHSVSTTVFPTLPIRFKKSMVFCGDALLFLLLLLLLVAAVSMSSLRLYDVSDVT